MNEREACAEISRRGYASAVVLFQGGNDEGGPDEIYYTLTEIDPETNKPRRVQDSSDWWNSEDDLVSWLANLPSQEYGSFAGDFDVSGTIVITPGAEKPVRWSVDEREEYSHREW